MDSSPRVSARQRNLLREFYARERRFVLTGGGALSGFHLGHRSSDDLDLFAKPPAAIEDGVRALAAAVDAVGGSMKRLRTAPEFQRAVREGLFKLAELMRTEPLRIEGDLPEVASR